MILKLHELPNMITITSFLITGSMLKNKCCDDDHYGLIKYVAINNYLNSITLSVKTEFYENTNFIIRPGIYELDHFITNELTI